MAPSHSAHSERVRDQAAAVLRSHLQPARVVDGWLLLDGPGHTPGTYDATTTRPARETAVYYALVRLSRELAPVAHGDTAARALENIASLVVTDQTDAHHGCMRWFAEETRVSDTNAAFFAMMPLAALLLERPDVVPAGEADAIRNLFRLTLPWFAAECRNPRLYYPNKIISDGAMLLGIGRLLANEEATDQALRFLRSWVRYTHERGWGWGENISLGYQRVILIALRFAILLCTPMDDDLSGRLQACEDQILAEAAFHDGTEFVPSIRSYNFSGTVRKRSFAYALLGHPDSRFEQFAREPGDAWTKTLALLLFPEELGGKQYTRPTVPRDRTRRVFDHSFATTWIGDGVRLGTISRFPVMPDHYQQEGWGLGWQSFPVSAALDATGVSALYWHARSGDHETTHPYYGADGLQRNYVLAGSRPYPAVATHAAQRGGLAVVVRTIARVHDEPVDLADQWVFRDGRDSIDRHGEWFVQHRGRAALAVLALARFRSGSQSIEPACAQTVPLGADLAVRVQLHEASDGPLAADRLEAAWVLVATDDAEDPAQLRRLLDSLRIADEAQFDFSMPRMSYAYTRVISVTNSANESASPPQLRVDYHTDLWR